MIMIHIINVRDMGRLFHYAHFLCDCIFPEVINEMYKYNTVYRNKTLDQTLGNFKTIYEEIMHNNSIEATEEELNKLQLNPVKLPTKWAYANKASFSVFRNYIFKRYSINPKTYSNNYPPVLLIRRGSRVNLISDPELLKNFKTHVKTGAERRDIDNIQIVEKFMKKKFKDNLGVIYLEEKRFEEQVKLFNNAKLIVMAHGAAMSNLFFCKKGTIVIEADCGDYKFFSTITKILGITHIRIQNKHNIITQKIIRVSPAELYNVMPEQPALPVKCIRDTCNFFKNSDPQNNKEGFCCRLCKIGDANHGKWCNKTLINSVPISKD